MMVLIIEILFFIVLVIAIVISAKLDNYSSSSYSVISLALMIIIWCINAYCVSIIVNQPTAIDVYKGKTELQITYKGTIPVDSVVVLKKNKRI